MSGQSSPSKLLAATDETFQSEVLESTTPVIVDFYTPTCGPCRFIKPLLEKLGEEYDGKVKVVAVNVAEHGEQFTAMGARGVPLVVSYHCGKEISRQMGSRPYPAFKQMFQSLYEHSLTEQCPSPSTEDQDTAAREAGFANAVDAADQAFFARVGPASEVFENEIEPDNARFEMAKIDAANKLSAGEVDQQAHDQLVQAAVQRFVADTAAAKQRLMEVVHPAEATRTATIEAARKQFSANVES